MGTFFCNHVLLTLVIITLACEIHDNDVVAMLASHHTHVLWFLQVPSHPLPPPPGVIPFSPCHSCLNSSFCLAVWWTGSQRDVLNTQHSSANEDAPDTQLYDRTNKLQHGETRGRDEDINTETGLSARRMTTRLKTRTDSLYPHFANADTLRGQKASLL